MSETKEEGTFEQQLNDVYSEEKGSGRSGLIRFGFLLPRTLGLVQCFVSFCHIASALLLLRLVGCLVDRQQGERTTWTPTAAAAAAATVAVLESFLYESGSKNSLLHI